MDEFKPILAMIVRHALTSLAGVLVTHGYLQSSATEQFIAGGLLFVSVAWGWWQKNGQATAIDMWKRIAVKAAKAPADSAATAHTLAASEAVTAAPELKK